MKPFQAFLTAYPPEQGRPIPVNAAEMTADIRKMFSVDVPKSLQDFWRTLGAGYFGDRELFFFGGTATSGPRDSIVAWNKMDFWPQVFQNAELRPFIFAETCFGYQLGFRYEAGRCIVELFSVDTFKVFIIAEDFDELFSKILAKRHALVGADTAKNILKHLPPLESGMHYAPILSPLAGGRQELSNMHQETPNVHVRTALATFEGIKAARMKQGR